MIEEWKDIEGYEGYYQISSFGRIKSFAKNHFIRSNCIIPYPERILKARLNKDGYYYATLCVNKRRHTVKPHRLVAIHFIDNAENKPAVNHIDGVKSNNRLDNLEWVTNSENTIHAHDLGLSKGVRGEKSHLTKVSDEIVFVIRDAFHRYSITQDKLAEYFNISQAQVGRIYRLDNRWETKIKVDKLDVTRITNGLLEHFKRIGTPLGLKTKRSVYKIDMETKQTISVFNSSMDAAKSISEEKYITISSSIRSACRRNCSSYGFIWKYSHKIINQSA